MPPCLAFPSVKRVLAVLTLRELFFMGCGHREQALLKEEVQPRSVLGAAGGCVFLLVLGYCVISNHSLIRFFNYHWHQNSD